MNKLWNLQNYSAETLHRTVRRDGLRIRQDAIIGLLLKIAFFGGDL